MSVKRAIIQADEKGVVYCPECGTPFRGVRFFGAAQDVSLVCKWPRCKIRNCPQIFDIQARSQKLRAN